MMRSTFFACTLALAALAAAACTSSTGAPDTGSGEDDLQASAASCEDKACGDTCTICDGRPDCYETADIKHCNAAGTCVSGEAPVCKPAYEPCGGKACGDSCTICSPNDPSCFETAVSKVCDAQGQCVAADDAPVCERDGGGAWSPCQNKACGDECSNCPPNDPDCFETEEVKICQPDGTCSGAFTTCK